ncbi:MAG TPA: YjdF family protein [Spirochaetota bacterium]
METKLTVFFDGRFWTGVFERNSPDWYCAARTVFGNEPSDAEIFQFIRHEFSSLSFSAPSPDETTDVKRINPKRLQRLIRAELSQTGTKTKAQEAIRQQIETRKTERKKDSKASTDEKRDRNFRIKQEKKKEKHKGH